MTAAGKYHRTDGPAVVYPSGAEEWYVRGILHREDGPASISSLGTKYWYQNGKLHRDTGPAIEWSDGDWDYYYRGKLHRLDGPTQYRSHSAITPNLTKFRYTWCVNDRVFNCEQDWIVARDWWISYKEYTRADIESVIGMFKIVEW